MTSVTKLLRTDVPKVKKEEKITKVIELLIQSSHGCVIVLERKKLVGIITESDVLHYLLRKKRAPKAASLMSKPVTLLQSTTSLEKASKVIDTKHFRNYPVVENESFVGIVTEHDVVQTLSENIRFHRRIQNTVLVAFILFELSIFLLFPSVLPFL